ncbi:MAG TPA: hypothetical protein VIJ51_18975 [Solirubrobacteraceae bacterium]
MTNGLMDRLAAANPVETVATPEAELEALLGDVLRAPRDRPRLRAGARRGVVWLGLAASVCAVLVATVSRQATPDAAARAYAAVALKRGEIVYTRYASRSVDASGRVTNLEHDETWSLPGVGYRTVLSRTLPAKAAGRYDMAVAGKVAVQRLPNGTLRPLAFSAQLAKPLLPGSPFAALYKRGLVRQAGQEIVAGHRADKLTMQDGDAEIVYDVDPANDFRPLLVEVVTRDVRTGAVRGTTTSRVTAYENLPDTAGNRALLTIRHRR